MASGSGTGTRLSFTTPTDAVYDQYEELTAYHNTAVPLHRYAKVIGYDECAFWGVDYDNQRAALCSEFWSQYQRMTMANALAEAQQDIETVIGYPLYPKWIVGKLDEEPDNNERWIDQQLYRVRQITRYSHFIEAGMRTVESIEAGASVNHATDPAVVGPLATDATDAAEIKVFYPNSAREIYPSAVTFSGGDVTITIPRCRLVKADYFNLRDDEGILYEDSNNFLNTVDVTRVYNDPSTNAVLVRPNCNNNSCQNGCSECTQSACMYVINERVGIVDVKPATYADGVWTPASVCNPYSYARLYYRAGQQFLSIKAEQAIIRLAHAKCPEAPCTCPHTAHLWERDRKVPDALTADRINCPWGMTDGAWVAYQYAVSLKQRKVSVM